MYLTEFQKRIVRSIASDEVTDIESFISKFLEGKKINFGGAVKLRGREVFTKKGTTLFVPSNIPEAFKQCKEFKLLLITLQKFDLIVLSEKPQDEHIKLNYFGIHSPDSITINHKLDDLLKEFFSSNIYATSDLAKFIENNFLTSQEIVIRDEKRDRIIAQRWTVAIALITILVSSIINFITNKQTKVKIDNYQHIKDTLYVYIVEEVPGDTTRFGRNLDRIDTLQVVKK